MPKEFHLHTGGQDPFVLDMGDVIFYIHSGQPIPAPVPVRPEILDLPPLDPTRGLVAVTSDVDAVSELLGSATSDEVVVAFDPEGSVASDQFQALLGGLYGVNRDGMRIHVVSSRTTDG